MTDTKTFTAAGFAKEFGLDPKKVRAALRRNMRADAKKVPLVLDGDSKRVVHAYNEPWTFPMRDRDRVARLVMTDAQFARYQAKTKKAPKADKTPTPEPVAAE